MNQTSLSMLDRLRSSPDSGNWDRLVELYEPLIRGWLRKYYVQESDTDDLVQEVLVAVSSDVGQFDHNGRPGAFRAWLKSILVNRLRKFWRLRDRRPQADANPEIEATLAQLEDPASEVTQIWNREHDLYVLRKLLELTEPHFTQQTWQAFRRVTIDGVEPDEAAAEIGITRNAVIVAKCRVLKRLRTESEGLVDASSMFLPKS